VHSTAPLLQKDKDAATSTAKEESCKAKSFLQKCREEDEKRKKKKVVRVTEEEEAAAITGHGEGEVKGEEGRGKGDRSIVGAICLF
jgi:hypothetical protein